MFPPTAAHPEMPSDPRLQIFVAVRAELSRLVPPLTVTEDLANRYTLVSRQEVIINGKRRPEVWFAGLIIQSSYVGFYFMPVYTDAELKAVIPPNLLRLLKGKSCFHLKKMSPELLTEIRSALAAGLARYRQRGWVSDS